MNFEVQGTASPRSYQRHLPGSARGRPQSAINPITGEEICYQPTPRKTEKPKGPVSNGKGDGIPSLNLNYLKDDDIPSGAIDIDLNDYSLDTPGSASTVSWGTSRSNRNDFMTNKYSQKSAYSTRRPEGVPGLSLGDSKPPPAYKKQEKQPNAWDGDPVPGNLPAPSARYKEMYKQYEDDMKQSYREYAHPAKVNQKEVEEAVQRIRSSRQAAKKQEEALHAETLSLSPDPKELNESWTKQRRSSKQMLKKMDADELVEHNKKQKLVETVMIDQLSRAVISDPQQDTRTTSRPTSTRWTKGSNRYLHDSKISTSSTATENLLSKRMRFGARILTRNGSDAMKELTGFYFACDKTLTVYEFRQFGKSAKAMPFIYRGQYCHKSGPKQGRPFGLSDIYVGANLKISTEGQLALTDSLAENDVIVLRVTDIDEGEKEALMDEQEDVDGRMHAPSKLDIQNKEFLYMIQDEVRTKIQKRGIRTVTGLGRYYRKLDQYKTGILDQYDLEKGLKTFRINLEPETLEELFDILDPEGMRLLDYGDYMHGILGEMNEYRKSLMRKAFHKLNCSKKGVIHISDVKKFFNVNSKYKTASGGDSGVSALQAFLEDVRENEKQELISFIEFEEYYEGLSLGIERDEDFANVLHNTWNI
ncbi:calcyphosin-2 [Aplysia californica]|uniref:Calcyphosin-2 n=1 Tax=Aplysia californica TaxID=6500 RepID=A0ABM0JPR9_APLCA|nr:calcyphosin-2 [Aplysia californica]